MFFDTDPLMTPKSRRLALLGIISSAGAVLSDIASDYSVAGSNLKIILGWVAGICFVSAVVAYHFAFSRDDRYKSQLEKKGDGRPLGFWGIVLIVASFAWIATTIHLVDQNSLFGVVASIGVQFLLVFLGLALIAYRLVLNLKSRWFQ